MVHVLVRTLFLRRVTINLFVKLGIPIDPMTTTKDYLLKNKNQL